MKQEIINLRNQFLSSDNEKEKSAINDKLTKLKERNEPLFTEIMLEIVEQNFDNKNLTKYPLEECILRIKQKYAPDSLFYVLEDVQHLIKWEDMKSYFPTKNYEWFDDRMRGKDENLNLVNFTNEEKQTLKQALKDIAQRINEASEKL